MRSDSLGLCHLKLFNYYFRDITFHGDIMGLRNVKLVKSTALQGYQLQIHFDGVGSGLRRE